MGSTCLAPLSVDIGMSAKYNCSVNSPMPLAPDTFREALPTNHADSGSNAMSSIMGKPPNLHHQAIAATSVAKNKPPANLDRSRMRNLLAAYTSLVARWCSSSGSSSSSGAGAGGPRGPRGWRCRARCKTARTPLRRPARGGIYAGGNGTRWSMLGLKIHIFDKR